MDEAKLLSDPGDRETTLAAYGASRGSEVQSGELSGLASCSTVRAGGKGAEQVTGRRNRSSGGVCRCCPPRRLLSTVLLKYDGWAQIGGTSVATPLIASVYALAGNASSVNASYSYAHSSALTSVVSGTNNNGNSCTSARCVAGPGWDGPTGLGTQRDRRVLSDPNISVKEVVGRWEILLSGSPRERFVQ
jgi:hypothetical protein